MPTELPKSALFVFAHPDDEFFCLPIIRLNLDRGRRVVCVYLTNGAYGGQSAQLRVRESTTVLGGYGVSTDDIHFVGVDEAIPDGKLHHHADLAYERLLEIQQSCKARDIYLPAWEGGHQDHDTCHVLGVALAFATKSPCPKQFALYHGYSSSGLFKVMSPLEPNGPLQSVGVTWAEALRALSTAFSYPSQWKSWLALLPFASWRVLLSRSYALQEARAIRLLDRPHAGPLLYERRGNARYDEIRAALQTFLDRIAASDSKDA